MRLPRHHTSLLSLPVALLGALALAPAARAAITVTPTVTLSSLVAGAHPDMTLGFAMGGSDTPRSVTMDLPAGYSIDGAAVPGCTPAEAAGGSCPAASEIGTFSTTATATGYGVQADLSGTTYLMERRGSETARFVALVVPGIGGTPAGPTVAIEGAFAPAPGGTGLRLVFDDLPQSVRITNPDVGSVALRVDRFSVQLRGTVGGRPVVTNPSACAAGLTASAVASTYLGVESDTATTSPWSVTGCTGTTVGQPGGGGGQAAEATITARLTGVRKRKPVLTIRATSAAATVTGLRATLGGRLRLVATRARRAGGASATAGGTRSPITAQGTTIGTTGTPAAALHTLKLQKGAVKVAGLRVGGRTTIKVAVDVGGTTRTVSVIVLAVS